MAIDGLTTIKSGLRPKDTMDRLAAEVTSRGMSVFARIDHAAGAASIGMPLRPTEVLIFGNAKGGTPLMQAVQTIGLDLPLKILVWQDEAGDTYLSPPVSRQVVEGYMQRVGSEVSPPDALTPRQREILQLIAEGFANKQIAGELGLSVKTVEKHRQQGHHQEDPLVKARNLSFTLTAQHDALAGIGHQRS